MPDHQLPPSPPGLSEAEQARRLELYDNGIAAAHAHDEPEHLDPTAIAACQLCNHDGYRGARICDHRDHFAESAHGRALVAAELDKIRTRRAGDHTA